MDKHDRPLAVVTGASRGIGFELAKSLGLNGYDLLVTAGSDSIVEAAELLSATGARVEYFRADMADTDAVNGLYDWIKSHAAVDVLVLNAGVGLSGDFMGETSVDENLQVIRVNVSAVVQLARLVGADMVARRRGRIMITSSIAAVIPTPYLAVYSASKAFVQSFTMSLRSELVNSGVTVTSLMPGPTKTAWFDRANIEEKSGLGGFRRDDPARVARDGYKAMMAGKNHVVAGNFGNRVLTWTAKILPLSTVAMLGRHFSKPRG